MHVFHMDLPTPVFKPMTFWLMSSCLGITFFSRRGHESHNCCHRQNYLEPLNSIEWCATASLTALHYQDSLSANQSVPLYVSTYRINHSDFLSDNRDASTFAFFSLRTTKEGELKKIIFCWGFAFAGKLIFFSLWKKKPTLSRSGWFKMRDNKMLGRISRLVTSP